ncbi:MAG: chorismate mutase [Clostridia bacterium]|nr:chorismate mutase [Clostridia bacterium]
MDLSECRKKLDQIDDQILSLFKERMDTVRSVAEYKAQNNMPIMHQAREREILERIAANSGEELEDYSKTLFSTLMEVSRSYQSRILCKDGEISQTINNALETTPKIFPKRGSVACQGVEGAYSQLACDKLFSTPVISYFKTFEGVFSAVQQGLCEYGILPIENSTHGTVNAVYDLMRNHRFYIIRSIKLKIDHVLLALPGTKLSDIKEIFSHEQAIGQCSEFLKNHPDIKVTVCENTAVAAQKVRDSGRKDVASISSSNCATLYGLNKLETNIQNSDSNFTRFICISKEPMIFPGANKISLMLSVPHRPGALYNLISKFSVMGLNLTKLESRPIAGSDFEFMFYFDMDASVYSPTVLSLLDELAQSPEQFVYLGSYSEV